MQRMRRLHVAGRAGENRYLLALTQFRIRRWCGQPPVSRQDRAAGAAAGGASGVLFQGAESDVDATQAGAD